MTSSWEGSWGRAPHPSVYLWLLFPPSFLSRNIRRSMIFPVNCLIDSRLAQSAMRYAATGWRAIDQRDSVDGIRIACQVCLNAETGMEAAILKKIAWQQIAGLTDWCRHAAHSSRSAGAGHVPDLPAHCQRTPGRLRAGVISRRTNLPAGMAAGQRESGRLELQGQREVRGFVQ